MDKFQERQQAEQFLSDYILDLEVEPDKEGEIIDHENITEKYQIFIDYNYSYKYYDRPATRWQPDESYYKMIDMEITKLQIFNNDHEEIDLSLLFEQKYIDKMQTLYIQENAER